MSYSIDELKDLPDAEKIHIINELLRTISPKFIDEAEVDEEELSYVEECLEAHRQNRGNGLTLEELTKHFKEKYGIYRAFLISCILSLRSDIKSSSPTSFNFSFTFRAS
jgi:hypothetical protein